MRDNQKHPFSCCVPFHLVHTTLHAEEACLAEANPHGPDSDPELYDAMTMALEAWNPSVP